MAYCIAIEHEILVHTCPLSKGQCYWQHKTSNACCFKQGELSVNEFTKLVGAQIPTEAEVQATTENLKTILL